MSVEFTKTYDPAAIEAHWYRAWEASGHFAPSNQTSNQPFCLMLPPPNVTGSLHMGHAFEASVMDCLVRYHRMCGDPTHWQVGTDHAGIATQMVVERQLELQGKTRQGMGRLAFEDAVWAWKEQSGGTIANQFKRMGISADWSRERFTLDEGLSKAVQEVFIRLYEEKLIYRGQRLVNWDCVLKTAVSDLEVEMKEEETHLWHIRYPLSEDPTRYLVVATTRPETLLGDAAVAVNPHDERYQAWIGQFLELPLTGRKIPVIADDYVEAAFGSGCVKITPAHDFNDYEVGLRHDLPLLNILNADGTLNAQVPSAYQGMERFAARKQIVADLTELGLVEKIEPYTTQRPRGDRSGSILEPLLTFQWFVKTKPLAEPAIAAVENGDIVFSPPHWANTYFAWMREIKDWCISRQLWWGHRIPAWYDEAGNVYVGYSEADIREKHGLEAHVALRQEDDVLDTWFSSALWPFSTLGWPEKTPEFQQFYPTNVLISGFDIIFFWVARMIMMGLKFTDKVPFKHVYIHGLICDSKGQKMSKSKGNVLDPLDLIQGISLEALLHKRTGSLMQPQMKKAVEKATEQEFPQGIEPYGTDALRLAFCSLPATQRLIQFDLNRLKGYRNFCNKLWNSARYVLMHMQEQPKKSECTFSLADRYIFSRLQGVIQSVHAQLNDFRFDFAVQTLYDFVWGDFCDWYLELSKPQLQSDDTSVVLGTRYTLVTVLDQILHLLHPFIPFITEEIAQHVSHALGKPDRLLLIQPYPVVDSALFDPEAEKTMDFLKNTVMALRNIRSEARLLPKQAIPVWIESANPMDIALLQQQHGLLKHLAQVDSLNHKTAETALGATASAVVGELILHVPLAGLIDLSAEKARVDKQLAKLGQERDKLAEKLASPSYTERAPEAVVTRDRQRLEELNHSIATLQNQRAQL